MKRNVKHLWLILASILIILSLLLAACGPVDNNGNGKNKNGDEPENGNSDKIAICHKTGNDKKPYKELILPQSAVENGHSKHEGDIIPAPKEGCPESEPAN